MTLLYMDEDYHTPLSKGDLPLSAPGVAGGGRRNNQDKASFELVPLSLVAKSFVYDLTPAGLTTKVMLGLVGQFQASGDIKYLDMALQHGNTYWIDCAKGFAFGRIKYDEWNWASGMKWSVPLGCIGRHALAVLTGEDIDVESNIHHIGLIMCNIVMLKTFTNTFPDGNDLPAIGLIPIVYK